ncbi:MAG: 50S ribosomal protein L33 [Planctomycetota bacterium]|nr:50S ribosomal protein L33 [Candidatus Brocadiaceae bacterium]
MREYLTLICKECSNRNYRTPKRSQETEKLTLKKFCKFCRKHTDHKEYKK